MSMHWTEDSVADFLFGIAADFVRQLEGRMGGKTRKQLAKALGVTPGRVSQILNNPGNLTLQKIIQYARALGLKVAIVAYDDNDPQNKRGPIPSSIFETCWHKSGRPSDFFELRESARPTLNATTRHAFLPETTISYTVLDEVAANQANWRRLEGAYLDQAMTGARVDLPFLYGGGNARTDANNLHAQGNC